MTLTLTQPCLLWTGATQPNGYGRRRVGKKVWLVHRYAYQQAYGDLQDGLVIDHLCFNRGCIEPTHLRQVTQTVNATRHSEQCSCHTCLAPVTCKHGHDLTLPGARYKPSRPGERGNCVQCNRDRNSRQPTTRAGRAAARAARKAMRT